MKYMLVFVLMLSLGGCTENADQTLSTYIEMDGSSSVYPLAQAVVDDYSVLFPEIKFSLSLSGTTNGFNKFCQGKLEVTNASRPMSADEQELCKKNEVEYCELIIANDAIVIAVNPNNTWCDRMDLNQLQRIWQNDSIILWSDLNPKWPIRPIQFLGPGRLSGTQELFFQTLYPNNAKMHRNVYTSEDHNDIVMSIFRDTMAIGYFALPFMHANHQFARALAIDDLEPNNGKGFIDPSVLSVTNQVYGLLQRPLYLYVNQNVLKSDTHYGFLKFFLSYVNVHSDELGFAPLSQDQLTNSLSIVEAARSKAIRNN